MNDDFGKIPDDESCRAMLEAFRTAPQSSQPVGWERDLAAWLRGEAGRHMASMRVVKGAPSDSHALHLKLWADLIEARAASLQSPSAEAVEEQMTYEQRLVVAIRQWSAKQKPLDAASTKVLYDNLWDMYVDDAAAQTARGASEENP